MAEDPKRPPDEQWFSVVAHELRSPLNAILVWCRVLRSESLTPERRREALDAIERNVRLQADLLDDLAELQRARSGAVKLSSRTTDVGRVVRRAAAAAEPEARRRDVELQVDGPDEPLRIRGDPSRLEHVARSLFSVLARLSPAGGGVTVEVRRVRDEAEIVIRDGYGALPGDVVDRLSRGDRADVLPGAGGAGVALALTEELIQLHRGFLGVERTGDRQTTIRLRLPLEDRGGNGTADRSLDGLRVLVVDDEVEIRHSLEALLEGAGAVVRTADRFDGTTAAAADVDVVVTDIAMPGSGYRLLREMRVHRPGLPVIALTGTRRVPRREQEKFDAWLRKPVEPSRLLSVLGRAASHRDSEKPNADERQPRMDANSRESPPPPKKRMKN